VNTPTALAASERSVATLEPAGYWRSVDTAWLSAVVAGPSPKIWLLRGACTTASHACWPLLALMAFHAGQDLSRWAELLLCLVCAGALQWVAKRLARRWNTPRPFALGLCPNYLNHSARGGLPSAHAVVMGTIAGFCCIWMPPELLLPVLVLTAATAWARVYTGAHFPLDVLVGTAVGSGAGLLAAWWWLPLTGALAI
jgi:undecaprenyl-diphosphatase